MQILCCCERVGPISRRFAASMVFITWADALLPGVSSGCFAAVRPPFMQIFYFECVGPIRERFAASMVSLLGQMLCCLEFLADDLTLLSYVASIYCWLPLC
jgi:hypothetical protein